MFGFEKNKENDFALVIVEREKFLSILIALIVLLKNSGNNAQAEFIQRLIELIDQNNFGQFVKLVNGVDMWGGAGAVWEIYIENKNDAKGFEKEMLSLINLIVYFSESIHPISFQTVQPDQGFFFLAPFHLASINAT